MLTSAKVYVLDADSVTTWLARATIAEKIAADKRPAFVSVRYQDAIRLAVENKLAEVGVTASNTEVKEWESYGHRVLAVSRTMPIKQSLSTSACSPRSKRSRRCSSYSATRPS